MNYKTTATGRYEDPHMEAAGRAFSAYTRAIREGRDATECLALGDAYGETLAVLDAMKEAGR